MMKLSPLNWSVAVAAALALPQAAWGLPVLTSGHTDVGVNYEDGAWDLHVHAEDLDLEYAPDAVWIKVGAAARTSVPSSAAFSFLGAANAPLWVLPAVQNPNLVFLGIGTEELAEGVFTGNTLSLALKSVAGPGDFIVYQLDAFGAPVVSFSSRDGIGTNDVRTLTAGGHTHVNWAFTAPGQYRIGFQASGVLAATGATTTSEIAEYLFDVGEGPSLVLSRLGEGIQLSFLSETNAAYQLQSCENLASNVWVNLGAAITGTGKTIDETLDASAAARFWRVQASYASGEHLGMRARLFIADTAKASLQGVLVPSTR